MGRILTLKEQIGKFFFSRHLDFLTSVPQRRIQEIILSSCTRGNSGKLTEYEKIPFVAEELDIEVEAMDCVYVSIDDIGVKRQKGSRSPEFVKDTKYVKNTVAHIQYGQKTYVLTAVGMKTVMKSILAFLFANGLLEHRLIFLTDGARNIKSSIEEFFSFHSYSIILDWFHLKKKCQELLSMAIRGRGERNKVLEKLLRMLWVGDVNSAISYPMSAT